MSEVLSVSLNPVHGFHKQIVEKINLDTGKGVVGDAHYGKKVKHRSRVRQNPDQPNLRQVHLIHAELFEELKEKGFNIKPGDMGENLTTRGISLLDLPKGTILEIGETVRLEVTGLRNPCNQLNDFRAGLMHALLDKGENGTLIRKAGIMSIVLTGGQIIPGDKISVVYPAKPYIHLDRI